HVLEQEKLLHVLLKSILRPKFWSTPSPQSLDNKSLHAPKWRRLWPPLDMSKPPQPSFPHLGYYAFDFKFRSKHSVRNHVKHGFVANPP
ncbi:hypothetical protein Tco_1260178, partial [Tanacetum coccineum]